MWTKLLFYPVIVMICMGCKAASRAPAGADNQTPRDHAVSPSVSMDPPHQTPFDSGVKNGTGALGSQSQTSTNLNPSNAAPENTTAGNDSLAGKIGEFFNKISGGGGGTTMGPNGTTITSCVDGDDFTCKAEAAIVRLTNEVRGEVKAAPLVEDFRMDYVARDWSQKQGGNISHTGFPAARAVVFGAKFPGVPVPAFAGENVATNMGGGDPEALAKTFVTMWRFSPGHYMNMVGLHHSIGVGVKCSGLGGNGIFANFGSCTATQIFMR